MKASRIILLLLLYPGLAFSSGDELIKSWKGKQEAYYKGEALVQSNSEIAVSKIENLLKKYKWNSTKKVELMHQLAELYLGIGRIKENNQDKKLDYNTKKALALYDKIINDHPNYAKLEEVLFSYGFELYMKDDYAKAYIILEKLNTKYPHSDHKHDALVVRADSLYELKNFKKSAQLFSAAQSSDNLDLVRYSKYKEAWSVYNTYKHDRAYTLLTDFVNSNIAKGHSLRENAVGDISLFYTKQRKVKNAYASLKSNLKANEVELVLSEIAEIYFDEGEWRKSIATYDSLIQNFSKSKNKAMYHLKKGVALSTRKSILSSGKSLKAGLEICKEQRCKDYANDDIFKLVNNWEKYWREKKTEDKNYLKALKLVYPELAKTAKEDAERSKIYLLLAELEVYTKNYQGASEAFEKAYLYNKKSNYAKDAFWQSIYSLEMLPKSKKWKSNEIKRLENLVVLFIQNYSSDKKSIQAQNLLAQTYIQSNMNDKALNLYANLSRKYKYSKIGSDAYNNYLKTQLKDENYEKILAYLIDYREKDEKRRLQAVVNKDLDSVYEEWTNKNIKDKKPSLNIKIYKHALKNRSQSKLAKDWRWNLAFSLYQEGKYKNAAIEFLKYEQRFKNKDQKQVLALENAYSALIKGKRIKESLAVSKKLISLDKDRREQWVLSRSKNLVDLKKHMEAYYQLSYLAKDHEVKNAFFAEDIVLNLNKDELRTILNKSFHMTKDSEGLAIKVLIERINDFESKEVFSLATKLSRLKTEDKNLNAYGFFALGMYKARWFVSHKYSISKNTEKSLNRVLKDMLDIDGIFRESIAYSSDITSSKSFIGLAVLFYSVPKKFYDIARKNDKDHNYIMELKESLKPFFGESLSFYGEAQKDLEKYKKSKKQYASLKRQIKSGQRNALKLKKWFDKKSDVQVISQNREGRK